ncbi:MAG: 50S ribosomal protein L28 [Candidatus Latescibacteria bacterium]|jgi:ribosomal protein L28|nr:50S ribosomal protein L28 [Candidatus Latescibacterota bacterium]|tara:strand:- start:462 stop:689 length:228 start_codon:yes stop_codon:yes gene_type:complete
MARKCSLTGVRGLTGNSVSHSQRKTKRVQQPNLIKKRIFIPEENRTVTLRLTTRALRTLNKKGVSQFLKEAGISV